MNHLHRRTDPHTSRTAAIRAEAFAASHAGRCLAFIDKAAPHWVTLDAISGATGLSTEQIDRRMATLQRAGHIEVPQEDGQDMERNGKRCWQKATRPHAERREALYFTNEGGFSYD